jgi:hypothetical protein
MIGKFLLCFVLVKEASSYKADFENQYMDSYERNKPSTDNQFNGITLAATFQLQHFTD